MSCIIIQPRGKIFILSFFIRKTSPFTTYCINFHKLVLGTTDVNTARKRKSSRKQPFCQNIILVAQGS